MGHARESEVARGTVRRAEGETERWMPDGLGLLRLCLTRDRLDREPPYGQVERPRAGRPDERDRGIGGRDGRRRRPWTSEGAPRRHLARAGAA